MALGWRGNVDDVRPRTIQELGYIVETPGDTKSLAELPRHQGFSVTNAHNFAAAYPFDLQCVIVRDLATAHQGDSKH
jgi:hypothetical protein